MFLKEEDLIKYRDYDYTDMSDQFFMDTECLPRYPKSSSRVAQDVAVSCCGTTSKAR